MSFKISFQKYFLNENEKIHYFLNEKERNSVF